MTTLAGRASRQSLVLCGILALHAGALLLLATSMRPVPVPHWTSAPIRILRTPPAPVPEERPRMPELPGIEPSLEPLPELAIPLIAGAQPAHDAPAPPGDARPGAGPVEPASTMQAPGLRTPDRRLAALIDACYPAASRRLGEEGSVLARVVVAARGEAAAWSVVQSSGFPRLDRAVSCVLRRLAFEPGRRDGRAVDADVMLPIVFRLH